MLTLYYAPGACSMAAHIVLEESGEKYQPQPVDLAKGEQRTDAYLKIHPLGRVPALRLDNGEPLAENTAILPYLGKRFGLWPTDPLAEAKALALIGFFASSVHPAHAHVGRPERYTADAAAFPAIKDMGLKTFHGYLKQVDGMLAGREWFSDRYSVVDPYGFVFYTWGVRRELPMGELKSYTAFKDRMLGRPAVARVVADEKISCERRRFLLHVMSALVRERAGFGEMWSSRAANSVCSLPLQGGGLGWGSIEARPFDPPPDSLCFGRRSKGCRPPPCRGRYGVRRTSSDPQPQHRKLPPATGPRRASATGAE